MNFALRAGYEGAAQLARALSYVAPAGRNKILDSLAARRGVIARFEAFGRDVTRPLLWTHAPSVGEGLQARPILGLMRARSPETQLAYTYFSPSARAFAAGLAVDFREVLPFDNTGQMRRAVRALSPTAVVFSKLDVWPTFAREAATAGARLGLISATLASTSSRSSSMARALLREAYGRLDLVGAVSLEDADRLVALGVPASRVSVTGDTRYDQVWARAAGVDRTSPLFHALNSDRPTLLAGSTWPSDECVIVSAWVELRRRSPNVRLIIAPHEPTDIHLGPIQKWAADAGLRLARLSTMELNDADVILVDSVGQLGDLYALASVAFVGGGFHSAGLHSVLEPAAYGVPVLFGPQFQASRDARLLIDADGAQAVESVEMLERMLSRWLIDAPDERSEAGAAAAGVVRRGLGAAERSYKLVDRLLA